MPDTKDTALASITAAQFADDDVFELVDKSDTTMAASGTNKQASRAQTAIGLARWKSVEVDFGSAGVRQKAFTVTDAEVLSTFNVIAQPSGKPATDRVGNDFAWDEVQCTTVPGSGNFVLQVNCLHGHMVGKRNFVYQISA